MRKKRNAFDASAAALPDEYSSSRDNADLANASMQDMLISAEMAYFSDMGSALNWSDSCIQICVTGLAHEATCNAGVEKMTEDVDGMIIPRGYMRSFRHIPLQHCVLSFALCSPELTVCGVTCRTSLGVPESSEHSFAIDGVLVEHICHSLQGDGRHRRHDISTLRPGSFDLLIGLPAREPAVAIAQHALHLLLSHLWSVDLVPQLVALPILAARGLLGLSREVTARRITRSTCA